jgi:hypothetical protein
MRAEHAIGVQVAAFAEQVQIQVADSRCKTVGIVLGPPQAVAIDPGELIVLRKAAAVAAPFEQVGPLDTAQFEVRIPDPHLAAVRQKGAQQALPVLLVPAQHLEGIVVSCFDKPLQGFCQCAAAGGRRGFSCRDGSYVSIHTKMLNLTLLPRW